MSTVAEPTIKRTRRKPGEPITNPFTVLIDQREITGGLPWLFTGMIDEKGRPLTVPYEVKTMKTADYSIVGYEDRIVVERKSLSDCFGSCGGGRENFEKEHERMAELVGRGGYACVIVEADWRTILTSPPSSSRMNPNAIYQTALSWSIKYHVHWMAVPGRRFAELTCFRVLRKFYDAEQERLKGEI
jgi:ERCC4-type nuclease